MVSLWNDHATNVGQELLDNADKFPIVAIKSLKVGDFQGNSPCFLEFWYYYGNSKKHENDKKSSL